MKTIARILILTLTIALGSCSEGVKKEYTIEGLDFMMEGPLFEGPNSASTIHSIDYKAIGVEAAKVKNARLSKVVLYMPDSLNFDLFTDFKLQLTADDVPMTEAAQLNPISLGSNRVELTTSSEAELDEFFKLQQFVILIDGNLKEDLYDNINFKADLVFNVDVSE
jgi:hypothetical protein